MRGSIFLALIFAGIISCDFYEQDDYEEFYVVESYMIANDFLPTVRLSKSSEISEKYSFNAFAVSDARIEIRLLNSDSTIAEQYQYEEEKPGIYNPNTLAVVQDERLYQLYIITAEGHRISSMTYVPKDFTTVSELQKSYTYQSNQKIEILATPSAYITGRQAHYIFTVNAIHPDSSTLTPFYRDLVFNKGDDIRSYYTSSSGIISENTFERNTNGNIQLIIPWLSVAFYDSNNVIANAIDDNMYNFLRSQNVQTGGIGFIPGDIQNIRYNVTGGIGIFGSMSSDTNRVFIKRP